MTETVYRFLPWSRRGLSAGLPAATDGAAVPARATLPVTVAVGGITDPVKTSATLYGPGDVLGLDPSCIVRTIPRPGATNVEPNYLAAVDFDQPELPWLFTPTGVPGSGHLAPWLVLVVVEDRAGVSVSVPPGSALAHLKIDSGAAAELPDLTDAWAWAHVQLLDAEAGASPETVGQALADRPDHNVSRLVCPRRLQPDRRWIACLVPAYDAGVVRGFGGTPDKANLAPAWTGQDSVELPVYHHWRFQTGPQGDFESLARRLRPYEASAHIGRVKMHVGASTPFLDPITDDHRFLDMDGALQAPAIARSTAQPPVPDPTLGDVPATLRTGLQQVTRILADAADGALDGQSPGDSDALGPPVYGGVQVRRTSVGDEDPTWFQELNTDPRPRVAAGLGADVLRRYQDEVMEACWQQVGDVISVETALSRARLSLEVARRFNERHLVPLPPGRFLQVTAPLAQRTLLEGQTLPHAIAPTSLPDRIADAAMRRLTSARGRVLAGLARRTTDAAVVAATRSAGDKLVTSLAAGRADVDATRFPAIAVDAPEAVPAPDADGRIDLSVIGAAVVLERDDATVLERATRDLRVQPAFDPQVAMRPRPDLRTTGLITSAQLAAVRDLTTHQRRFATASGAAETLGDQVESSSGSIIDAIVRGADRGDTGFLAQTGGRVTVSPLTVAAGGAVVAVNRAGANAVVAHVDRRLAGSAGTIGELVGRLPARALAPVEVRRGGTVVAPEAPVTLQPGAVDGQVFVRMPAPADDLALDPAHQQIVDSAVEGVIHAFGQDAQGQVVDYAARMAALEAARSAAAETVAAGGGGDVNLRAREAAIEAMHRTFEGQGLGDDTGIVTITLPPTTRSSGVLDRYTRAIGEVVDRTSLGTAVVAPHLVPFALGPAVQAVRTRSDPELVQPARLDAMVAIAGHAISTLAVQPDLLPGWLVSALLDRVMAYPHLDHPAYTYLAEYDRTRFCPGIDEVPPESITLLETNPRFVAGFMAGLNVETDKELLWRGFPSDGRGTPWRRFWQRADGSPDIFEMHTWGSRGGRDDLPVQTTHPESNLVLLVRGDLLRRYPNTMVVAVKAVSDRKPSTDPADLRVPDFAGRFDPDVSFFGFPLVSADLTSGAGWFFGLLEPVTEPRFGLDETVGRASGQALTAWNDAAWPDTGVAPGGHLTTAKLAALGLSPSPGQADGVAAAMFQRPFKLLVHAKHLVKGI